MRSRAFIVTLVCMTLFSQFGCAPKKERQDTKITEVPQTDLLISKIDITPEQPRATNRFTLNVEVTNQGNKASEDFDLTIFFHTTADPNTLFYCLQDVRKHGIQPNKTVTVYSSTDRTTNNPGQYELQVLIRTLDGKKISKSWKFNSLPSN